MKVSLLGHYESAFVHLHDETYKNDRNTSMHPYYMDLNRRVDKLYIDSMATFVSLSESIHVSPQLDWNGESIEEKFGIVRRKLERDNDIDDGIHKICNFLTSIIFEEKILTRKSIEHIKNIDIKNYNEDQISRYWEEKNNFEESILKSYIRRFVFSIFESQISGSCMLCSELELSILNDISIYMNSSGLPIFIPFPDIGKGILNPDKLLCGILSFSPKDIESIRAVRNDPEISNYRKIIQREIMSGDADKITQSAISAYHKLERKEKIDGVLEVVKTTLKPINYVPALGTAASITSDLIDAALKITSFFEKEQDWHLIGVKMQKVSIEDFLKRKNNQFIIDENIKI